MGKILHAMKMMDIDITAFARRPIDCFDFAYEAFFVFLADVAVKVFARAVIAVRLA